jgi:hypothetical protein
MRLLSSVGCSRKALLGKSGYAAHSRIGENMKVSFRRSCIVAASALVLGISPGVALAIGSSNSPTVSQEANQAKMDNASPSQSIGAGKGPATAQTSNTAASGVTSGPAVNSNVVPNTSVAKQETSKPATTTGKAAIGVGAPGTPAKHGTEGGPAPKKSAQQ